MLDCGHLKGIFGDMEKDILYLGDTALDNAAAYLAGVMTHYKISYDYLRSDEKFDSGLLENNYKAVVISDYPAARFSEGQLEAIAKKVKAGTGLLMIGGWESFTGLNLEYNETILKELLPVVMKDSDDRVNCSQPAMVEKNKSHEIVDGLPFEDNPPAIGGFNQLKPKAGTEIILSVRRFKVSRMEGGFIFMPDGDADPLLVLGSFGKGRVVAYAGDVAPHWATGIVDWGEKRVAAQAKGAEGIEVGSDYMKFFFQLISWIRGGN